MGLTNRSTGINAQDTSGVIRKQKSSDRIIALAGNPNVGKSTVFNALTGMNQHTGNWPGKTVTTAWGYCRHNNIDYLMVDIPGTYSLMAHSAEEEVARNFICFREPDTVIVVCDATCLERNLNLVLQTMEITDKVVVCVNLMDEAKKKHISIDLDLLQKRLGVPVVGTTATKKRTLSKLMSETEKVVNSKERAAPAQVRYDEPIEKAIALVQSALEGKALKILNSRFVAIKLLEGDEGLLKEINNYLGFDLTALADVSAALRDAGGILAENDINIGDLQDRFVTSIVLTAEAVCEGAVTFDQATYNMRDRRMDKILTGKFTGFAVMFLLLLGILWLSITGANYPSQLLSSAFLWLEGKLNSALFALGAPAWLQGILIDGIYKVVSWVVSVMLPPMAIFFPLFTLLEDFGYLPRVAFNLDKYFKKCDACGKQSLTMCMG